MPIELPEELAYLNDVITKLESFDPESLGDDNPEAMDIVEAAVRQRLRGMNESDAKATIQRDLQLLEETVATPELASSPIHYIYGAIMGVAMYADINELLS